MTYPFDTCRTVSQVYTSKIQLTFLPDDGHLHHFHKDIFHYKISLLPRICLLHSLFVSFQCRTGAVKKIIWGGPTPLNEQFLRNLSSHTQIDDMSRLAENVFGVRGHV